MNSIEIEQFPCLNDNYGYLIHDKATGATACIDTPEFEPIMAYLKHRNWTLTHIFNTHHHADHTGCNLEIKEKTSCKIIGPANEFQKIPAIDYALDQDDMFQFGKQYIQIINVSGHTKGHIAYYIQSENCLFIGDALFSLGCGRLFEGTAEQMWKSLYKISLLPPETQIYCAHEYTQANANFALSITPNNPDLKKRKLQIDQQRQNNEPTIPIDLSTELKTNPFLRVHTKDIRQALNMELESDIEVFSELRRRKDMFT